MSWGAPLRAGKGRSGAVPDRPSTPLDQQGLLEMLRKQLVHLEHADLLLAAEDRPELGVGVDHPTVGLVLKAVLLDVDPHLLDDLRARERLGADDLRKLRGRG